jgi:hypothetical protein
VTRGCPLLGLVSKKNIISCHASKPPPPTLRYARSNVGGSTVVTETGTITAGLFVGDNAVEVITGPTLDTLECLSEKGVTDRVNALNLDITSP